MVGTARAWEHPQAGATRIDRECGQLLAERRRDSVCGFPFASELTSHAGSPGESQATDQSARRSTWNAWCGARAGSVCGEGIHWTRSDYSELSGSADSIAAAERRALAAGREGRRSSSPKVITGEPPRGRGHVPRRRNTPGAQAYWSGNTYRLQCLTTQVAWEAGTAWQLLVR